MESLFLLIPLSLALVGLLVWILRWSIKSGQFDDLDGPGHAILMDDDAPESQEVSKHSKNSHLSK
jgi:cbb3-type cytochrome oxidase maturation protein